MGAEKIVEFANGKPAAIFGAGVSGVAAQKLLGRLGIESVVYAQDGSHELFDARKGQSHNLFVYSPAFRPDNKWIAEAEKCGECICETDLSALAWEGEIVAVTGTNGKTTLTKFLTSALANAGKKSVAVGNIGTPLCAVCAENGFGNGCVAVYELSSFQTSKLKYLRPDAVVWTNFDADHLDWHKSLEEYFQAKTNLVRALRKPVFIAGSSVKKNAEKFGVALPDFAQFFDEENVAPAPAPFSSGIQARNFAAAEMFWRAENLDAEILEQTCKTFALPPYRFSSPAQVGNVRFYNDSKATNVHAAVAAIRELSSSKNLVWLGGGKDKYCDLTELVGAVAEHCKAAVLIGQTAKKLESALAGKVPAAAAESMQDAVKKCLDFAKDGGDVLFSPAFSSFGMFNGYKERGKSFDDAVLYLKNSKIV